MKHLKGFRPITENASGGEDIKDYFWDFLDIYESKFEVVKSFHVGGEHASLPSKGSKVCYVISITPSSQISDRLKGASFKEVEESNRFRQLLQDCCRVMCLSMNQSLDSLYVSINTNEGSQFRGSSGVLVKSVNIALYTNITCEFLSNIRYRDLDSSVEKGGRAVLSSVLKDINWIYKGNRIQVDEDDFFINYKGDPVELFDPHDLAINPKWIDIINSPVLLFRDAGASQPMGYFATEFRGNRVSIQRLPS